MIKIHVSGAVFSNKITSYPNIDFTNLEYEECLIICNWNYGATSHTYKVLANIENHENDICAIVKPINKYKSFEFEQLFGFSADCSDFDENRTTIIKYRPNKRDMIKISKM